MYQMEDMDISDQYNKRNSKFKLHASLSMKENARQSTCICIYQGNYERLLTGKSWISVKEKIYYQ